MHNNSFPKHELMLNFVLIDLKELIEKIGVKAVIEQMDETLILTLNAGIRGYYIRKANERLNESNHSG